jgi:phosphohistidine phosphatase
MLSLYLIRHAKSSWTEPGLDDLNRPLNKRGKTDAPLMAEILLKRNEIPELVISSSAKRALSTAKRIAKTMGIGGEGIKIDDRLYMASETDFFNIIWDISDDINRLMLVSHNPGLTDFVNILTGSNILNIPTSGIVRVDFDLKHWKEITKQNSKFIYFEYPKMFKTQNGS